MDAYRHFTAGFGTSSVELEGDSFRDTESEMDRTRIDVHYGEINSPINIPFAYPDNPTGPMGANLTQMYSLVAERGISASRVNLHTAEYPIHGLGDSYISASSDTAIQHVNTMGAISVPHLLRPMDPSLSGVVTQQRSTATRLQYLSSHHGGQAVQLNLPAEMGYARHRTISSLPTPSISPMQTYHIHGQGNITYEQKEQAQYPHPGYTTEPSPANRTKAPRRSRKPSGSAYKARANALIKCAYDKCGGTFRRSSDRKRHYKSKHDGERHMCSQCTGDKSFSRKDALGVHIRKFHSKAQGELPRD